VGVAHRPPRGGLRRTPSGPFTGGLRARSPPARARPVSCGRRPRYKWNPCSGRGGGLCLA